MATVGDILRSKGYDDVRSVAPDTTVYDALKLMAEKNIGAVLVMEADTVMGILSERDYARKIVLQGKASADACLQPGDHDRASDVRTPPKRRPSNAWR